MKVYEAIPELLGRHGVDVVFSMLGGTNVPWVAEGVRQGLFSLVKTRHEETAVHAATAYSRASGSVGICTVTRAPGFANSVNGLIAAMHSHIPLLLIVAESPAPSEWSDQSVNQRGLSEVIGAGFRHVSSADDLEELFWASLQDAYWNGSPQVLSIGDGLLETDISLEAEVPDVFARRQPADDEAVRAVVDALERSQRPLVLAGQGAVTSGASSALLRLADRVGARVANTLRANRFFAGHPHDLGLCGTWSPQPVRELLEKTDLVLAFGASLNERTTGNRTVFGGATIVHCEIDLDRPYRGSSPELALLGDARLTAEALVAEWERRDLPRRSVVGDTPSFRDIQRSILSIDLGHDPDRGLDLRQVYAALDAKLPDDRVIVTDSGRSLATSATLLGANDAHSWVLGRGYGTVGLGIGTAIGAAVAHPGRPVVLFCGDGGFMMAMAGLDTIRLYELPIAIVIMNDEQLGAEVKHLKPYGLPLDVIRQDLPPVPELAAVYGGRGVTVRTEEELADLSLSHDGLEIVDCRLDPQVDAPAAYS